MPLDPSRIRAICFDVDGTLSDTDDLMVSRIARRLTPIRRLLPARDPRRIAWLKASPFFAIQIAAVAGIFWFGWSWSGARSGASWRSWG